MESLLEKLDKIDLSFNLIESQSDNISSNETGEIANPYIAFKMLITKLTQTSDETLGVFGAYLYYTFYGNDEDEQPDYNFNFFDCVKMLSDLSDDPDCYESLLFDFQSLDKNDEIQINYDFSDADDAAFTSDNDVHTVMPDDVVNNQISERVSNVFAIKNMNRKKRKFFTLSKADLRRTAPKRKLELRMTFNKRKRYYNQHKNQLSKRAKMYNAAIKKGRHFTKLRRKS